MLFPNQNLEFEISFDKTQTKQREREKKKVFVKRCLIISIASFAIDFSKVLNCVNACVFSLGTGWCWCARWQRALVSSSQVRERVFDVGVLTSFNFTFLKETVHEINSCCNTANLHHSAPLFINLLSAKDRL